MTIFGWVCFAVIAAIIMGGGIGFSFYLKSDSYNERLPKSPIIVCSLIVAAIFFGMAFYYNGTEAGKRAFHTQDSELQGGLDRSVRVYDVQGDLIYEFEGRFDVDYDDDRVIFDDENGNRHVIYYSVATVVIEELEDRND